MNRCETHLKTAWSVSACLTAVLIVDWGGGVYGLLFWHTPDPEVLALLFARGEGACGFWLMFCWNCKALNLSVRYPFPSAYLLCFHPFTFLFRNEDSILIDLCWSNITDCSSWLRTCWRSTSPARNLLTHTSHKKKKNTPSPHHGRQWVIALIYI